MKKQEYFVLTYREFDELVKEKLGVAFDFLERNECNNDSSYTFKVYPPQEGDTVELSEDPSVYDVLGALCIKGFIEPGLYLIEVCW
jgi:hypothetical protein